MSRRLIPLVLLVCAYSLISLQCTVQPTAGTETGNPDITACLSHAFTLLDTSKKCLPSQYLPAGEVQLNPERVFDTPGPLSIAKKRSDEQNTDGAGESGAVTAANSIVIVDTMLISKTIIVERVENDTMNTSDDWGMQAGEIVRRIKYYDSLFVVDTVITRDTVTFATPTPTTSDYTDDNIIAVPYSQTTTVPDSLYTILTGDLAENQWGNGDPETDSWKTYVLERDSNYLFPEVRSDSIYVHIGRSYTSQDFLAAEMYYDNDGDGYLSAAGSPQQCTGMFHYRNDAIDWNIEVDFDAGADMIYSSTSDNRIDALFLTGTFDGTPFEIVRYGRKYFGSNGDSLFLAHSYLSSASEIGNVASRWAFITGNDPKDHRQNRIVNYSELVEFNYGEMKKAEYELLPNTPLTPGNSMNDATIRIVIDFGKGLTGCVEADIDFGNNTISGLYAVAGDEYQLEFSVGDEKPRLTPVE